MAKQATDELPASSPALVTFSGTVRGGSGWNDPPVCHYDPLASGVPGPVIPQREHPFHRRRGGRSVTTTMPNTGGNESQLEAEKPGVQLYPPTLGTDPSMYVAPIIVPNMSNIGGICVGPTAMNPVTSATVAVVTTSCSEDLDVPQFEDDEQMFHYVVTRLQRALKDSQLTCDPRASEEMSKKVNIFSDMWKNGKISYPVKSSMARLATAIHKRRCEVADQLQASLMMDHVSEVNKWLVGIKRLIQEVRLTDAPMSPSNTSMSQPTVVTCMTQAETSEEVTQTVSPDSPDINSPLLLLANDTYRTLTSVAAANSGIVNPELSNELQRFQVDNSASEPQDNRTELSGDLSCTEESVTLISNAASALLMSESTSETMPVVLVPPVDTLSGVSDVPQSERGKSEVNDRLNNVAQQVSNGEETVLPNCDTCSAFQVVS